MNIDWRNCRAAQNLSQAQEKLRRIQETAPAVVQGLHAATAYVSEADVLDALGHAAAKEAVKEAQAELMIYIREMVDLR